MAVICTKGSSGTKLKSDTWQNDCEAQIWTLDLISLHAIAVRSTPDPMSGCKTDAGQSNVRETKLSTVNGINIRINFAFL